MAQLYKEPKQANTEHRNSPQNSRPSSPKPDVAIIKDQINTRMQHRGLEMTTPMWTACGPPNPAGSAEDGHLC